MNIKMNCLIMGVALMLVNISCITAQDDVYAEHQLMSAVTTNDYTAVSEMYKKSTHSNNSRRFHEIIREMLKNEFDKINLKKLVKYISTQVNNEDRLLAYSTILHELEFRRKINGAVIFNLAEGLKDLMYEDLSPRDYAKAKKLKNYLPESVKLLIFADKVCIRNNETREYMYAANDYFKRGQYRRRIFTWIPDERPWQDQWIVELYNDVYHIKNSLYDEYLYAPARALVYYRYLFTWDSHTPADLQLDDEKYGWIFEPYGPYGDTVLIKNQYYNEYMSIADDAVLDTQRRYVIFRKDFKEDVSRSLWKIEKCN